jgi:hypothetical protein
MAEREQLGRNIAKRHRVAAVKALAQGLGQGDASDRASAWLLARNP